MSLASKTLFVTGGSRGIGAAIAEKALGPEHPDTGTYINGLANVLYAKGKLPAETATTLTGQVTAHVVAPIVDRRASAAPIRRSAASAAVQTVEWLNALPVMR